MYKYFVLLLIILSCTSCTKKYKIEGVSSVSLLDGKMLFIKVFQNDQWVNIDSAEVIHGNFKMEGKVDSVVMASLFMDETNIMPLVIENGSINIKIDNAGIEIKGTELNNRFNTFLSKKNSLDDRAYALQDEESRMIMDGKDLETIHATLSKKQEALTQETAQLFKQFIQDNYDNVLGTGVFVMVCSNEQFPIMTPLMEEILNKAPQSFLANPMVKRIAEVAKSNRDRLTGGTSAGYVNQH